MPWRFQPTCTGLTPPAQTKSTGTQAGVSKRNTRATKRDANDNALGRAGNTCLCQVLQQRTTNHHQEACPTHTPQLRLRRIHHVHPVSATTLQCNKRKREKNTKPAARKQRGAHHHYSSHQRAVPISCGCSPGELQGRRAHVQTRRGMWCWVERPGRASWLERRQRTSPRETRGEHGPRQHPPTPCDLQHDCRVPFMHARQDTQRTASGTMHARCKNDAQLLLEATDLVSVHVRNRVCACNDRSANWCIVTKRCFVHGLGHHGTDQHNSRHADFGDRTPRGRTSWITIWGLACRSNN